MTHGKPSTIPTRAILLVGVLVVGGIMLAASVGQEPPGAGEPVTRSTQLMGTEWTVRVLPPAGMTSAEVDEAIIETFAEVARIEQVMSEWIPDSPISQVNDSAGAEEVIVPVELVALVRRAVDIGRLTDGAFDVTWRPLGDVWRFDDTPLPTDSDVDRARALVDYTRVEVSPQSLRLPVEGMALGLGGIAKGYAVDRAAGVLRDRGIERFYIDGGGDIRVGGGANGRPWRVGIRDPRGGPDDLVSVVAMNDAAVVTSGDYERFRMVEGVRYHHIIDPRTGRPATSCTSVTVVADSAEWADAMATAVFVLGPEAGLALIEQRSGAEALIVDAEGRILLSTGFNSLGDEPEPL